nr:uncharacterized protein LOC109191669 [Ipomoea trifida]
MRRFAEAALGILLFWLCFLGGVTAAAEYVKYKDPKQPVGVRIRDLMKRMSLAEKVGQMTQIERHVASPDVINKYFIGSVLSGGGSTPVPKAPVEAWVNMVNEMQKGALSTRLGIPMLYGIDAVHGHNNVYGATVFPHNVGLGVTRDPELVKRIGAATALEVRATGLPYVFAPCIAVCRDPRWGRCYESYSEDHKIVQMMTEIIPGLQGDLPASSRKGIPFVSGRTKVAACAKHFVGDGGTFKGIDENNTVISLNGLFDIHMPAYIDSIRKGVSTVMVSYSSWNGLKMHANRALITGFLKDKLKFRGFVISDWEGVDKITDPPRANYTYAVQSAVLAGIDMRTGNSGAKKLLRSSCFGHFAQVMGTTILSAVKRTVDPSTQVVYQENPDTKFVSANHFDYAIVVVGELPYAEMFGDSSNLTIAEPGASIINNVCGAVRCVVVVISGRPVVMEPYVNKVDAIVAAWLPGTEGQGVADLLFGDYGFTGKLARTWFKSVDQLPMNVGDPHYDPLFPFGFGLVTKAV